MKSFYLISILAVAVCGEDAVLQQVPPVDLLTDNIDNINNGIEKSELVQAFVVFRHGDRTPDEEELAKFPSGQNNDKIFFPYGKRSLTNKGKQRGYRVGEYLRKRYDNLISGLYLPDEVIIRTTDYSRTKMTALTALAALYPPPSAQRWNPFLNWQPVPYNTMAFQDDDLLYYYNCPRYLLLRERVYNLPEFQESLQSYQELFKLLSTKSGTIISTPEDVFYLDNLFQTLNNVGVSAPKWAQEVMTKIKELTILEYATEFYNSESIRLASGVVLSDILNATKAVIVGNIPQPKLYLISAHENNVAALMAAVRVFKPHQPKYGSTISLELRRQPTGQYGFMVVYAENAGGPGVVLPVAGCGGQSFCDYDTFINLTRDNVLPRSEYKNQCSKLDR